jgi:hypothetical protein
MKEPTSAVPPISREELIPSYCCGRNPSRKDLNIAHKNSGGGSQQEPTSVEPSSTKSKEVKK